MKHFMRSLINQKTLLHLAVIVEKSTHKLKQHIKFCVLRQHNKVKRTKKNPFKFIKVY